MALLSHAEEPEREAAMDKHKKQSQDVFDEELRHEMREAEEAQKRVWEKIQKMSPEERRKMAAGVPGPEDREELPLGTSYKPMPRRRLGGAIKVGALAAAALLVVISSGTFSIGNKEHEYHVAGENGEHMVNNTDVLGIDSDINLKISIAADSISATPILFNYWPSDVDIKNMISYEDEGYAIIDFKNEAGNIIYMEIYHNSVDTSLSQNGLGKKIKDIDNDQFSGNIELYSKSEKNEYFGVIKLENTVYYIGIFDDIKEIEDILINIENIKN